MLERCDCFRLHRHIACAALLRMASPAAVSRKQNAIRNCFLDECLHPASTSTSAMGAVQLLGLPNPIARRCGKPKQSVTGCSLHRRSACEGVSDAIDDFDWRWQAGAFLDLAAQAADDGVEMAVAEI
jgi:hypothetical protein